MTLDTADDVIYLTDHRSRKSLVLHYLSFGMTVAWVKIAL